MSTFKTTGSDPYTELAFYRPSFDARIRAAKAISSQVIPEGDLSQYEWTIENLPERRQAEPARERLARESKQEESKKTIYKVNTNRRFFPVSPRNHAAVKQNKPGSPLHKKRTNYFEWRNKHRSEMNRSILRQGFFKGKNPDGNS